MIDLKKPRYLVKDRLAGRVDKCGHEEKPCDYCYMKNGCAMNPSDCWELDMYLKLKSYEDDYLGGNMVFEHEIEAMPAITPTPQWIPVAERLPEIYKDEYGDLIPFLVCLKDTDYPFRAFFDGKTWGDGFFKLSVVAWMPLPEPYKMDVKDGDGE